MRILAIRGKNLASLAESFALDLEAEPLRSAGLFAITGETGAGKSTLLDALCLALYDTTPRLEGDGGKEPVPDHAGKAMKAKDPRTVLRRGAHEGFAEVDFIAHDGARYRATWLVRRAYGKATGAIMDVERMLQRQTVDGIWEAVASGKKPVETAMAALTELDFAQFRRTALLAQGEFDAFLRADESQRADILEKITSTGIYGRISIEIHRRSDAANRGVEALEAKRDAIAVLDKSARTDLEGRRTTTQTALDTLARDTEVLTLERATRQALDEAAHRATAATDAVDRAETAAHTALPMRERRALIARAEPMRRLLADEATARQLVSDRAIAAEAAMAAVETVARRRADALIDRTARDVELEREAATVAAFEPIWERAAAQDALVQTADREREAAAKVLADAEGAVSEAATGLTAAQSALDIVTTREAALRRREEALSALAPFGPVWPTLRRQIEDWRTSATALATARETKRHAVMKRDEAKVRIAQLVEAETSAATERAALLGRIEARGDTLRALAEDAMPAERQALQQREEGYRLARTAANAHATARDSLAKARLDLETAEATRHSATTRSRALETELAGLRTARQAQQAGYDLAEAIDRQEAAALRGLLVDGEPCPVCGSTSHPVMSHGDAITALARKLKEDRRALDASIATAEAALVEETQRVAAMQGRIESANTSIARYEAEADHAAMTYAAAAGLLGLPSIEASDAALAAVGAELARQREALDSRQTAIEAARKDREALRETLTRHDQERDERNTTLAHERTVESDAAVVIARSTEAITQGETGIATIERALDPLLDAADLSIADLRRDAATCRQRLDTAFETLKSVADERTGLLAQRAEVEDRARQAGAAKDRAEAALAVAKKQHQDRDLALRSAIAERATLLDGEPTVIHRERAQARLATARQVSDRSRAKLADLDQVLAADEARAVAAKASLSEAQASAQRQTEAVEAGCAALVLDRTMIDGLLAVSPADLAAMDATIATVDADLLAARAVLAEAQRHYQSLEAASLDHPPRDLGTIDARLTDIEAERRQALATIGEVAALLAADDSARDRVEAMRPEIDVAKAHRDTIAAVDDAIGSADGARFRRFAQGVTLDRLIALANTQLATLAPRYRLRRADSGSLGLLIIDRDMGDQLRSTRSLSGGERFLASLALALALSGLEGRRSFVDTLFIDEGFGALDAATLDTAIDALEALQSQGRRVGVISHVAAMIERIAIQVRVEKAGAGRSTVRVAVATRD